MRSIRSIRDVVDWGLCVGCGACYSLCDRNAVSLVNVEEIGIRPQFRPDGCSDCRNCLSICPGYFLDASMRCCQDGCADCQESTLLIGPTQEIWEGHAIDEEIRFRASSGGMLSALALYCLEKEDMAFVLHTSMNPSKPWTNITVQSRSRMDIISRTGSRYAPSSPCDSLRLIEQSDRPCVFIGKPCDVAAISQLRKVRPSLDKNLGLVLTFFCAGTPSSRGTLVLLEKLSMDRNAVGEIKYRGDGWPGEFRATGLDKISQKILPYKNSWSELQRYRPFRCNLCPDGLGELADISCGDAWHRYLNDGDPGRSLILVRSVTGKKILERAVFHNYVELTPSAPEAVMSAQGLPQRRRELFGRLMAMRILFIPVPRFVGFGLFRAWLRNPFGLKVRTFVGTLKRVLMRGLWHPNPLRSGLPDKPDA